MTLRHLKIFVAVCECGGITRAAEAMHITQPAVSHTIGELEKYYNITLFERINQRLVLTDMGREVLSKAKEIVGNFEEFEEFVACGSQNPRVNIGCSLTLGQTAIPQFLCRVRDEGLAIKPRILIKSSAAVIEELEDGRLDFALIEGDLSSPYLVSEPLKSDRILLVARSDYEISPTVSIGELVKQPLLLRERGSASRELLERAASRGHVIIEPLVESNNNQAIVASLYSGLGLAVLPESYVSGHIKRGKFKEIALEGFDGHRTNRIVKHKNKKLSGAGLQAYSILKEM